MLNRNHALSVFDPFREIEKVEKSFFDDPWANFGRTFTDSFGTDVTDELEDGVFVHLVLEHGVGHQGDGRQRSLQLV